MNKVLIAARVRHHAPHFTDKPVATRDVNAAAEILESLNDLHQEDETSGTCQECGNDWPCRSWIIVNREDDDR
jgi:hypothetical protein